MFGFRSQGGRESGATPRRILAALVLLFLAGMLVMTFQGVADDKLLSDDAYYYFEVARNAARGDGFTFDRIHPTNGFHPLWAWLLVPAFLLFPDAVWTPIHVALGLAIACVAGTAWCIFALFERHARPLAGLVAAILWLVNPYTWVLTGRGLETPLACLCIALALLSLDGIRRRGTFAPREVAGLGGLLGLCLLARTDNVLLFAACSIVLLLEIAKRGPWALVVSRAGLLAVTALAVVSPWIAWNLVRFGTVVQTSFASKQLFTLYGQLPPVDPGLPASAIRNLGLVALFNAKFIVDEEWVDPDEAWTALAVVAAVAVLLAAVPFVRATRERPLAGPSLRPMGLFFFLHFAWYAWIARSYSHWYLLPPVLAFCLFAGDRLERILCLASRAARTVAGTVVLAIAATAPWLASRHVEWGDAGRSERRFLDAAPSRLLASLPDGSRAGAWNAGRIGYFSSFHHPDKFVVNLDGVVNNSIPRYARESSYEAYLLENVDYIVESPETLAGMIGFERAQRFVTQHLATGGRVIR